MYILIDNYDSFTYMLQDYLLQTGVDCKVVRNDELSASELIEMGPERIIISPGPETPVQAGISMGIIDLCHKTVPILGVCLGHQALGMYFGAKLMQLPYPMHGKTSEVTHDGSGLFTGIPSPFTAMRYHSLIVTDFEATGLQATAHSADGSIMALRHTEFPCVGVQFHPESVGTQQGLQLLRNWVSMKF